MEISRLLIWLSLATFTLTRTFLLVYEGANNVPLLLWPIILIKGLFFDMATLAYLLPPVFFAEAVFSLSRRRSRWVLRLGGVLLGILIFVLLFLSVAEIVFWIEFHTRFNFIALDYLIYTNEVFRNIWQSYPIVWIFSLLGLASAVFAWILGRRFANTSPKPLSGKQRAALLAAAVILPILSAQFISVETMYRQGNAFAEELSGNGLFTLAGAARNNELDYDKFYATVPPDKAKAILKRLGVEWTDDLHRRQDRWGDDAKNEPLTSMLLRRPKNIILISVESLSAKFVGAYGSTEKITPRLDRLAAEGLTFSNVYATGTRTVRGLEALSLSTPPIPGQAIIRRPKNAKLTSVGEMLSRQGYEVFFLYGGYGYFDNMNAFFSSNGYVVLDRKSLTKDQVTFENAWGVADEDLFNNVIRTFDRAIERGKPMFAHVMTTSNHRPYTYPAGRIDIPSPGGRKGAVKYTDYAIGNFIESARSRPWFKDTLFVIVADHCASVAGRTVLPVADYRIPLILYGPGIVRPGRFDRMISQIDIPPTLLDMLGVAGDDNFFGKEVWEQEGAPRAFISNYQNLGYYREGQLIVLKPKRGIEAFRVDPTTFESTPTEPDPALAQEAIAYYQTAADAFKQGKLKLLWK